MKRQFISLAIGAALVLAPLSAIAADDSQQPSAPTQSTLTPGPAAGTQKAQMMGMGTLGWVAVGAAVIAVVAIASSGNNNGHATTTTSHVP